MPTDQTWTNWSGNLHSQPVEIAMPSNTAEVRDLMRNRRGRTIRAFGTCHSMSPLIVNDGGVVVDLSKFTEGGRKAWRWQNKGQDLVSFLPSARWADVREALTTTQDPSLPRMYLSTTGALATINATGFVAAGCHGTGWHQPTISDLVYAVEFVGADGGVHSFSEDTTPDDMAAVRVNFGMLGIITKLTLRAEPMYRLHDRERIVPIEEIMGWNPLKTNWDSDDAEEPVETRYLHRLVTENDYVELFWFPGSGFDGEIWVKQFNRTTESVRDVPPRWNGWEEYVAAAVMGWSAKHPAVWDLINPGTWSTVKGRVEGIGQGPSKGTFVAEAPDVLFYVEQAFPILDFEMAIPIPSAGPSTWDLSNVVTAWWGAVNYAHKFEDLSDHNLRPRAVYQEQSGAPFLGIFAAGGGSFLLDRGRQRLSQDGTERDRAGGGHGVLSCHDQRTDAAVDPQNGRQAALGEKLAVHQAPARYGSTLPREQLRDLQ